MNFGQLTNKHIDLFQGFMLAKLGPHKFLLVILTISFVLSACVPGEITPNHPSLGIEEIVISSSNALYPLALEQAKIWDLNASLKSADFPFWPNSSRQDPFGLFTFHSSTKPKATFFIKISETETGYLFEEEQRSNNQDQQLSVNTIPISEILDSRDALDLILEQGGSEFIQSNPGMSWPTILILEHQDRDPTKPFIWRVTFINKQNMNQSTYVLDAKTGERIGDHSID